MAKEKTKTLERTYNIPLRKGYSKVAKWKRTKKAVKVTKEFLKKHMKAEEVKLGPHLNQELWKHGIKNPPHHIKVMVIKDDKGVARAELFGHHIEEKKKEEKISKLEEVAKKVGIKSPVKKEETTEKEEKKGKERKEEEKQQETGGKILEKPEKPGKENTSKKDISASEKKV